MITKIVSRVKRIWSIYSEAGIQGLMAFFREQLWMKKMRDAGLDLEFIASDVDEMKIGRLGHQTTPGPELSKILKTFPITNSDAIIDVGSGKGGALFTMVSFPFGQVAGLEFSPELNRIANENILKLGIKNISLFSADATQFHRYSDFNFIYLFNPFVGDVFDGFMQKVKESLLSHPRKVTILYGNPICHTHILQDNIFKKVNEFRIGYHPLYVYTNDLA